MEHIAVYGWALVIVLVVGVVLWQMGVFTPGAGAAANFSGFGQLRPVEFYCRAVPGPGDTVVIIAENGAGGRISNATITAGAASAPCGPQDVPAGGETRCTISADCGSDTPGSRYEVGASISYVSPTGEQRSSAGTIWGPAE